MSDSAFSFTAEQLRKISSLVLEHAARSGASACETDVSEGFGQTTTVRKGEVETIEYNRDKGVGVTVYVGQQRGHASTSDFSEAALRRTVDAALSIARFTAADAYAGLPEAELLARDTMDLDLYHPWQLTVENAIELARECEQAAFDVSSHISNSEGASVSTQQSHFVSANSLGFVGGHASSRHSVSCCVIAGEDERMQREHWYDSKRSAADLADPALIGRLAAERAIARLDARKIPTCTVPVLFEAPVAVTLLGHLVHATSGGALYRNSSFLMDSLGKQILPPHVTIRERPHLKKAFGVGAFDSEGVATRPRDVVRDGILQGYFLSSYSARKLGMQTTGNAGGSHNLLIEPGEHDFDALVRQMDRGLIVTELLGHGVSYVTGDYSRGAVGFWVENGKIQYPVEEITIAGNLVDMFKGIQAIGNDVLERGSKHTGSILLDRLTVAGN